MNNYKGMRPFRWFVLENFPFIENDFEAINDYRLFSKVVEKLNEVIKSMNLSNEQVENLTNKLNELENYINNLDLQDEVSNKLDEMAEDGFFENIFTEYLNINFTYYFNNVDDMKNSDLLVEGYICITNGYHESGDGGGGIYQVISAPISNIDEGKYIALQNNKIAKLLTNEINIKQYGAYGDGVHDDTESIKNIINYFKNLYNLNTIFTKNSSLNFLAGRYRVTQTIEIPIVVKINLLDNVFILSEVENDTTFWINSGNFEKTNSGFNIIRQQSYNSAPIITGNGILCVERNTPDDNEKDVNNLNATSIAFEIGDRVSSNYLNCARTTFENIAISGFSKGIQLNSINTYMITFKNINMSRNRINFQYSTENMPIINSGEKFVFERCVFAQSYNSFVSYGNGEFIFNEPSFDFNGNDIICNKPCHLVINSPHFECPGFNQQGIIDANEYNCTGFGTIIYNNYNSNARSDVTAVEINNPNFYLASAKNKKIPRYQTIFNGSFPNLIIKMRNLHYFIESGYTYENVFMNSHNVQILGFDTTLNDGKMPTIPYNDCDNQGKLNNIPDNSTSLESLENNYGFSFQNVESFSMNTSDKIYNKSINAIISQKTYFNIRRKIENPKGNKMTSVLYVKPNLLGDSENFDHLNIVVRINFYNSNNIALQNETYFELVNSDLLINENNGWIAVKPIIFKIPTGCDYLRIQYSLRCRNSADNSISCSGNVNIGGMICDDII